MARTGVVFRPIIPKKPNVSAIPGRFRRTANKIADDLQEELEAPTLKWKHRVKFAKYIRYGYPKTILIRVTTTDEVYGYQDQGTKAHMVKPKRAKALAWTSKAGSRLFSKGHRVRGVKAQHWTNKAKRKYQPRIKRLADELMEDVARDL
jgi:hypothetical protein